MANEAPLRARQRAQIRADIRRAAFRLFIERGYDAVTTDEIAAAAGVSPRTFFRYVPAKEELILGPARHAGAEVVLQLEQRPPKESPDVALTNAILARTRDFAETDSEEWREAMLLVPGLLDKVSMHTPADKERATKLIAKRMGVESDVDLRPGLLVHVGLAAADFAFQQWVRQSTPNPRPLHAYVTEALDMIKGSRWRSR
ncbi:TetR family transcriptional regulator [Mycobacterium terramassiliense]|uniref:Transcriptional regulator n=1 Tax=Mycobacterium terramassiliense TaxID=1841859 RepID=A0A2U3NGF6_9MYCO|nr:TetR family transcriptional regulator [Mycobacterium terramassiliense]SPM30608.1 transcriptional regulator [Mycobacterium terramassiliense]